MMRLAGIDILRGVAIVLMVIFHFCFDLNNFHIVSLEIRHGDFWKYFRYFIVSLFVFTSGISLYLAHKNSLNFKKIYRRTIILAAASLLVTVGSYTQFPKTWIYFGILHFFLFSSLVGLLFLRIPKIAFLLGVFIIAGYNFGFLHMHWLFTILQPLLNLPIKYTQDLASVVPWFGVFLLGISFAQTPFLEKVFHNSFFDAHNILNNGLSFLGKHSLLIYLIHQPIFFAIFYLVGI